MKKVVAGDLTLATDEVVDDVSVIGGDLNFGIGSKALDVHLVRGTINMHFATELEVFRAFSIDAGEQSTAHVTNFQGGTAVVGGFLDNFHAGNAAGAEIIISGARIGVEVESGNVDYTIEGGGLHRIVDGRGNSEFRVVDSSMVIIEDGAGHDTVFVDADSIVFIESGEGRDVYVIEAGADVSIVNFDVRFDTIIFDGQEVEVTADGCIDPDMMVCVDVDEGLL